MQAVHDLLRHGTEIARYDHLEFPGVVPRSFLGAMAVAAVAWPLQLLSSAYCHALQALGSEAQAPSPALLQQLSARLATATLLWLSFCTFESGVARRLGPMVAELTTLLTCLQFHLPFYMSRTLPNTLALALCLVAFGAWLRGAHTRALLVMLPSLFRPPQPASPSFVVHFSLLLDPATQTNKHSPPPPLPDYCSGRSDSPLRPRGATGPPGTALPGPRPRALLAHAAAGAGRVGAGAGRDCRCRLLLLAAQRYGFAAGASILALARGRGALLQHAGEQVEPVGHAAVALVRSLRAISCH